MVHKGTVRLETQRLILRRFTEDDAQAMYDNWASDPEVSKYLTWPSHKSVDDTRKTLKAWIGSYDKPDYYHWAVELKSLCEPFGGISIVSINEKTSSVHVGYCFGQKWWRKGYASEALNCVVNFFFEDVKANRFEARHDTNNPASGKVMQNAGLFYEGTMREADTNNQGICDVSFYAMLAKDYFARNAKAPLL
ncbi:MAG: GNAT family N-acetyltransferase [Clostridiales bacterium]|jgi:ribosomal-protein-alanine N-acetyltransferase|nr:GNAT family N-acetyltransferase [Clostridiales bacterium]